MADKPVDPGLFQGPRGTSEVNPLGLSLGFVKGSAMVTLKDRTLRPGLTVRALELVLAEVEFPLNLEGGAEEFQRRSTRLKSLVVDLELDALAQALSEALDGLKSPIHGLSLALEGPRLLLEAELGRPEGTVALAELYLAPGEPRELRVHVASSFAFGPQRISTLVLPEHLAAAARGLLLSLGERVAQSFRKVGAASFAFDPVDALLWALLPRAGWKIPQHDEAPIRRLELLPSGKLRLVVGDVAADELPAEASPAELLAQEERLLRALAREDAGRVAARAEPLLEGGEVIAAFEAMRTSLDASGGPEIVRDRLFALGVAEPRLHAEVLDLVEDVLARTPDALTPAIAKAAIFASEGRSDAGGLYEKLARQLKERGHRRAAGLAYRQAAELGQRTSADRARLLEEAIALRPDDVVALRGLVDELPGLGRASAAVRAARRLANLAKDQETRVRAHVAAGELLRSALSDPAQAKRELERALKLAPDDTRALESLAKAVTDQGDPKRAAAIWERLIREAEGRGHPERAAEWSVVLGNLWRPIDAEAALLRYRQAYELDPRRVEAYACYAELCRDAGRREAAIECVERALPLLEGVAHPPPGALTLRLVAGQLYAADPRRAAEAIQQYEAALAIEPEGEMALLSLDTLYRREALGARRAPILGRLARHAAQRGELDRAAALWQEHVATLGDAPDRLLSLSAEVEGVLHKERGHRGLLEVLLEIGRRVGDPARQVGVIERRLLLDDPPSVRAELYAQLGAALETTGRGGDATRAYEEALGLEATQPEAVAALTRLYRSRGDQLKLAAVLDRYARLLPQPSARAAALAERAEILAAAGRDAEALQSIRASIELIAEPRWLSLATELALRNRDTRYAREVLHRRLELTPADAQLPVLLDLARVAEESGDRDELIGALVQAQRMADPISDTGRSLAARLATELAGAERLGELAELERQRGRVAALPTQERAERLLEAARLSARLGDDQAVAQDVEEALELVAGQKNEQALRLSGLQLLLDSAERRGDAKAKATILGRWANAVTEVEEQERCYLEQATAWRSANRTEEALDSLLAATQRLPSSLLLHQQLGEQAEVQGRADLAARSLGRAAILAEERGQLERALDLHARAAAAARRGQDEALAAHHDQRVVQLSPPGRKAPELLEALERLMVRARSRGDDQELVELLGRRASASDRWQAAEFLLEQAEVAEVRLKDDRRALEALRRAREQAPENTEVASAVLAQLERTLGRLGLHAERAAVLVEQADRATDPKERSRLYLLAARVYADPLGDRGMALSRAQAAVRSDPLNQGARQLRIDLLRESGRKEALAEALSEEAAHGGDAAAAAALWLEAAEVLVPTDRVEGQNPRLVEQAMGLARRAATATPRSARPLEVALAYVRAGGRTEDELLLLSQILERDPGPAERLAYRLRRLELLELDAKDSLAAQAELDAALRQLGSLDGDTVERALAHLPPTTAPALGIASGADLRRGLLDRQLELSERDRDWNTHVRALLGRVDLAADTDERVRLRLRAGTVLEHELGDAASAEREYLAALAVEPNSAPAQDALHQLYLGLDRFEDLAQNLGTPALESVWRELGKNEPRARRRRLAEVLWPLLPAGSAERAEVQLALADLYSTDDLEPQQEVQLLEQIVAEAPSSQELAALERLGVYHREAGHYDRYAEVLRRRAERIPADVERARITAELGEVLEWKLGDGVGAEREYRTALAIDPTCVEAQSRLAELLTAQDRYVELGRDLGLPVLERTLASLLGKERQEARAIAAAEALAGQLPASERGALWLKIAEAAGPELARPALKRAAGAPGPLQTSALDRYLELLEASGERGEMVNVLRQRLDLEEDRGQRVALHVRLAERVLAMRPPVGTAGREAIDEEAERELRRALELEPTHPEARTTLRSLYLEQGRFLELGRVLGKEELLALQEEATGGDDRSLARTITWAVAELSEGPARAEALLQLIADLDAPGQAAPGQPTTVEGLYRAALAADPESIEARQGLRALLEVDGRFEEIADALGTDALRQTVQQLRPMEAPVGLPSALAALTRRLAREGAPASEQAQLSYELATLYLARQERSAAEHALRQVVALAPEHREAKEELRQLLVAERRLSELAEIDETLVAITATQAATRDDLELQIQALIVLADRRSGPERADTLVLVAALERRRDQLGQAQAHLQQALAVAPEHAMARSELENLLWDSGHYSDIVAALGVDALIDRVALVAEADPARALVAVEASESRLSGPPRAELLELAAAIPNTALDEAADRARRKDELLRARALWDTQANAEGQERTRLALVELLRHELPGPERLALVEDALQFARSPEVKARLALEQANLLAETDQRDQARAVIEPLLGAEQAPASQRLSAARMLVEDLLGEDAYALSPADLELKARALEVLTTLPRPNQEVSPAEDPRVQWFLALAAVREARGDDPRRVAEALEAALGLAPGREAELPIRRRLQNLYEELGEWAPAEAHASVIAEAEPQPQLWVAVAELRTWLDDREGAKEALDRALELDPGSRPAHESLLRLAEQADEPQWVITRLEAWAEADRTGNERERADRLLRAAGMAAAGGDADRAALLAERAVSLMPRGDPGIEAVARAASEVLEPLGQREALVAIWTRVLGDVPVAVQVDLRLRLADLLVALERYAEAATVVEQGIHRDTPSDDPVLARLLADNQRLDPEVSVRRLLALADRLGTGPAARRLRAVAAERAETLGEAQLARTAWSSVAAEVGVGQETRQARSALIRLARELDDRPALFEVLVDAAEDAEDPADRAALYLEAAELADQSLQDPDRAVALLRRVVAERPTDLELEDRLVRLLERHGRWLDLEEVLAQRTERVSGGERAATLLVRAKLRERNLHDPEGAAQRLVEAFAAARLATTGVAAVQALARCGQHAALEPLALEVLSLESLDAGQREVVLLARAEALEALGRIDEAALLLAELDRNTPRANFERRAELLARHGRWAELALALEAAAARAEPSEALRLRLAAARVWLERVSDPARAEVALKDSLRAVEAALVAPNVPLGLLPAAVDGAGGEVPLLDLAELAAILPSPSLRVDALRLHAQSLPGGPGQRAALLALARAEEDAGDLEAAEFTLRGIVEALANEPNAAALDRLEVERSLAAVLMARGDREGAIEALSRVLAGRSPEAHPGSWAKVAVELASALEATGRVDEAAKWLLEARNVDPRVVPEERIQPLIEAGGPSEAQAELFERRAAKAETERERAQLLRRAAAVWEALARWERALSARLMAHEAEPSSKEQAEALADMLYEAERWEELVRLYERRLEADDLTDLERAATAAAQARVLALHLGQPLEGLKRATEARDLAPVSLEILHDVADYATAAGDEALRLDAWARIFGLAPSARLRHRALVERALGHERLGELVAAVKCMEEAVDLALESREIPRALVERALELHRRRKDHAAEARLLVKVAAASSGKEAAALYCRAAHVRLTQLQDRRGAIAAFGAAALESPLDVGIRRALIDLSVSLGDLEHAKRHARAAVEAAEHYGEPRARLAYQVEQAHFHALLGEQEPELELWGELLRVPDGLGQSLLDELVHRARSGLDPLRVDALLAQVIGELPAGQARGRYRLARARVLEEVLGRSWEAQTERELVVRDDRISSEPGIAELTRGAAASSATGVSGDEHYRLLRSMLDRSGRWEELAELEERRAAQLEDPLQRSNSLLQVARFYGESQRGEADRIRDALLRALEAYPDNVEALARLARLEVGAEAWNRAGPVFDRLESLLGPAWPTPEFELLGARVAHQNGRPQQALARLLAAKERDPGSPGVRAALAQADGVAPALAATWIEEHLRGLDPILDEGAYVQATLQRSRLAATQGQTDVAIGWLEALEDVAPGHTDARSLRLGILEAEGRARPLLSALSQNLPEMGAEEAPELLERGMTAALEADQPAQAAALAARLAAQLERDDPRWPKVLQSLWAGRPGGHLLRAVDAVGGRSQLPELSEEQRARLVASYRDAGRWAEAAETLAELLPSNELSTLPRARARGGLQAFERVVAGALGLASPLSAPESRSVLHRWVASLQHEEEPTRATIRVIEALTLARPDDQVLLQTLAQLQRRSGVTSGAAALTHRRLLTERGLDVELLEGLVRVLPTAERDGAAAVLSVLQHGRPYGAPATPAAGTGEEILGRVLHELVQTPLAEVLALTALPVAAALPPRTEHALLRNAAEEPRLDDLLEPLRSLLQLPFSALIDPARGAAVTLESGPTPVLVIGERLLDEADGAEIRFHLARGLMLLQLGALTVERLSGPGLLAWLGAVLDPPAGEALEPPGPEVVPRLRELLGPGGVDTLGAMWPAIGVVGDRELAPWVRGALLTANRFGALYARDLAAAVRGLERLDPRLAFARSSLLDPQVPPAVRLKRVKTWSPFSDLVAFFISNDYTSLLATLAQDVRARDRF